MRLCENTILNLFFPRRLLCSYYMTLQYVAGAGHLRWYHFSMVIFAIRELSWFVILSSTITDWTRTVLTDYFYHFHVPPEFNILLFLGLMQVFYNYHLLYKVSYGNQFSDLPYRVICLRQTNCFQSVLYNGTFVCEAVQKLHRKVVLSFNSSYHFAG